ncbi:flagellar hook-basal body complex protein FliE [Aureimonas mangrovi]|uniref:flagellar hook-basal body complex protein FliE n=1 Tax=Aureimonas mangrovi TaxID=2758041 RepID=UPI00163D40F1|nr:flagellar hook-basal body complex protein FliE [Aureimonas mangrovi]
MIPAIGSTLPRFDITPVGGAAFPSATLPGAAAGAGADFSSVMSQVAADAVNGLKAAEQVSIQGVQGSASTQAVVEAVMNAERTLQTAVAVRDKVVSAYLELSRMAI